MFELFLARAGYFPFYYPPRQNALGYPSCFKRNYSLPQTSDYPHNSPKNRSTIITTES